MGQTEDEDWNKVSKEEKRRMLKTESLKYSLEEKFQKLGQVF